MFTRMTMTFVLLLLLGAITAAPSLPWICLLCVPSNCPSWDIVWCYHMFQRKRCVNASTLVVLLFCLFFRWLYPECHVIPPLIVGIFYFRMALGLGLFESNPFEGPNLHHRWSRWNELENSSLVFHTDSYHPYEKPIPFGKTRYTVYT